MRSQSGSVIEELVVVFTNPRFLVVTCDVVPLDSVCVEIVEDRQAGFFRFGLEKLSGRKMKKAIFKP